MRIILVLVGITLCASSSISLRNTEDVDAAGVRTCEDYCGEAVRKCRQPPFSCGGCLRGFTEKDGECLPLEYPSHRHKEAALSEVENLVEPDSDIDQLANAPRTSSSHSETADINKFVKNKPQPEFTYTVNRVHHDPQRSQEAKLQKVVYSAHAPAARPFFQETVPAVEAIPRPAARVQGPLADNHGPGDKVSSMADIYFLAVVAGCSVAGVVGLVIAGVCWFKIRKNMKAASEVDYPAYGVTGPSQEKLGSPGDRKLAQSAQMYHYQHQKQQMIAMEKANNDMTKDGSDVDSDEENEEGDYTVFECPGLAPTGEMEVKNPLFNEDTPATPSQPDPSHPQ